MYVTGIVQAERSWWRQELATDWLSSVTEDLTDLKAFVAPDVEQCPPVNCYHFTRSCAAALNEPHVTPASFISCSTPLLQVFFGLPLFLCPWGFHWKALLALLGFLNVYPIPPCPYPSFKQDFSWFLVRCFPQVHISRFIIPAYSKNLSEWSVYKYLGFVDELYVKTYVFSCSFSHWLMFIHRLVV